MKFNIKEAKESYIASLIITIKLYWIKSVIKLHIITSLKV